MKFWAVITGVGLGFFLAIALVTPSIEPALHWWMLDVNQGLQADAHLVRTPSGENWLIDMGYESGEVLPMLKQRGVDVIHLAVVSHPHKDHYGGLIPLIRSSIPIRKIIMNLPPKYSCEKEYPWGCHYGHVRNVLRLAREHGIEVTEARTGQTLAHRAGTDLTVVYAHDGHSPPVGVTDINDLSLILRLKYGTHSILFTGDLNNRLGSYLAEHDVRAHVLKVPHHGTESLAPNAFFEAVSPQFALVPSPKTLWLSPRSARTREYFEKRKIPTYINGLHGTVQVTLGPTDLQIKTEKKPTLVVPNALTE